MIPLELSTEKENNILYEEQSVGNQSRIVSPTYQARDLSAERDNKTYEHSAGNKSIIASPTYQQTVDVDDHMHEHYESDMYHGSETSLGKSLITWLMITFLLVIFSIPLYAMMTMCIIMSIPLSWQLTGGKYTLYIISISVLSILYILYIFDKYPIRVVAFYSILPLAVSMIFRDCIIFTLQIRENIRKCIDEKKSKKRCFRYNIKKLIKCNLSVLNFFQLDILLSYFAQNYHIWGKTLDQYEPFGSVLDNQKQEWSFKKVMNDVFNRFDDSGLFSFKKSWQVSYTGERIIMASMICCCILYVVEPALYYIVAKLIVESHTTVGFIIMDIIQFILGIGVNIFLVYSVALYTEVLFYRLCKYYNYMKRMCDLIAMRRKIYPRNTQINHNDSDSRTNATSQKASGGKGYVSGKNVRSPKELESNDEIAQIYLCEGNNCEVWLENWCRIHAIASFYFERKKSWIFGVILSIMLAIINVLYYVLFFSDWLNANVLTIWCALIYFIVAFIRLLMVSIRFTKLQQQFVATIQIQHTITTRRRTKMGNFEFMVPSEYLKDIANEIRLRSVNPKIAGVSLDVALVKLSVSAVFGVITFVVGYILRQI